MYSEEDIDSAVGAGVLSKEAADSFRSHIAELRRSPAADEEHFRLITGFNDIFVVIACLLLLTSIAWIGSVFSPWFGALLCALVAWVLAEYFVLKRRMALPAIVLLMIFVGSVFFTIVIGLEKSTTTVFVASGVATAAAWLHWLRFKVPITVAVGAAALLGAAIALLLIAFPEASNWSNVLSFIAGVLVFALAIFWDASDTRRQTGKSDVAFWLHLLAAPLLVHPVFSVLGIFDGHTSLAQALSVAVLYILIALVSLAIDRRALMVSALVYVLYTFSILLKQYGIVSLGFAFTALTIGSSLLLLSAFWRPCRQFIVGLLPQNVARRLAPVR